MLSRVADSMYWIGRFMERAENTARLLEVNLQLLGDFEAYVEGNEKQFWWALIATVHGTELFEEKHDDYHGESVTEFLAYDPSNFNSILSSVNNARENARMIRDQISTEMWECINSLYHQVKRESVIEPDAELIPYSFFESIKSKSNEFNGLIESCFFHEEGYHFIQLGKFIERADQTTRMLDFKHLMTLPEDLTEGGAVDTAGWVAVLRSCGALDAFHGLHTTDVQKETVAEFLMLNGTFPRSVRFCVRSLDQHLRSISGTGEGMYANQTEKLCGQLRSRLAYMSVEDLLEVGLHETVDEMQRQLNKIHDSLHTQYLRLEY